MDRIFIKQNDPLEDMSEYKTIHKEIYSLCSYTSPGTVIIFNHYDFSKATVTLGNRKGTEKDVNKLDELFKQLQFNIHIYHDLTADEITSNLNKHVSSTDWDTSGSIVLIVLTHGEENGMLWSSDKLYHCSQLLDPILKCDKLKDKFKFIILQACRGRVREKRFNVHKLLSKMPAATQDTPSPSTSNSTKADMEIFKTSNTLIYKSLPKSATNLLIAHATVEGCDSVRDTDKGTWYIQHLYDVLDFWFKHEGTDLLDQMTVLNFEMNTTEARNDINEGQTATFTSYLMHSIYYKETEKSIQLMGTSYANIKQYKGRAYIYFDEAYTNEAHQFKETLTKLLMLPILHEIDHGETALTDICKISYQNNFFYENCILFAIFTKCESIINNNVPLKLIYNNFSTENCPSLADRPKFFFFFDAKYIEELDIQMDRTDTTSQYVTNHADFFICRGHSKEFLTNINHEMLRSIESPSYHLVEIVTAAKIGEDQNQEYTSNFESTLGRSFHFRPQVGAQLPKYMLEERAVRVPKLRYEMGRTDILFTGRETEINILVSELSSKKIGKKIITLFGMSGVGKTQIVATYCKYFPWMFNNILWFDAENEQKLAIQFEDLAKKLNLINNDNIPSTQNIVNLVYDYFKNDEKTLFIFDNYTNVAIKYLPNHVGTYEIYFVITTNVTNTLIDEQLVIEVFNFNKNVAIEFLKKILNIKIHSEDDIEKLAEFLGYNPLSLHLSATYIKEKNITTKNMYSINTFIKEFTQNVSKTKVENIKDEYYDKNAAYHRFMKQNEENKFDKLLNVTQLQASIHGDSFTSQYDNSFYEMCKIKILKIQDESKLATLILYILAFCEPEKIPLYIFINLLKKKEQNVENSKKIEHLNNQKINNAFRMLVNENLINRQNNIGSIHILIQECVRDLLINEKKEKIVLNKAIEFINILIKNPKNFTGFEIHAIKICTYYLEYINFYDNHIETVIQISKYLIETYTFNQAFEFMILCNKIFEEKLQKNSPPVIAIKQELVAILNKRKDFTESLAVNENVISIVKLNYGENSKEFMNAQIENAKYLQYLKKHDESIEILTTVLSWFESQDSKDVFKLIEVKKILASVLLDKKEYVKSLRTFENILGEEKTLYSKTDIHVIDTLKYVAIIYEMNEATNEKAVEIYQEIIILLCQSKVINHVLISEIQLKLEKVLKNIHSNSPTKQEEYRVKFNQEFNSNQESLGIDNIQTIITQTCLISCMATYKNKRWQALQLIDNLLQICKNKLGNSHERTLQAELKKAEILRLLRRKKDAVKIYVKLHETYEENCGSSHLITEYILQELVDIRSDENCLEEIVLNYETFLYEKRDIVRDEIYDKLLSLSRQANVNIELENYIEAAQFYEQMLKLEEAYFPVNDICNLITKYCNYNVCKYVDTSKCKQMIEELSKLARESFGETHDLVLLIERESEASKMQIA